jgi:hypothetical protein
MDKIDTIKSLFSQIDKKDKKDFYDAVAGEFQIKPVSARLGWFHHFEIPSKYKVQENLIVFMKQYIKNLNSK